MSNAPPPDAGDVSGAALAPLIDVGLLLVVFLLMSLKWTSFADQVESRLPVDSI